MKQPSKRIALANIFGTLGYISVLFQWTWSILLLTFPLLNEKSDFFAPSNTGNAVAKPIEFSPTLSPLLTFIALLATVLILVATIIVLVRLPKTIGKKSATATRAVAHSAIPIITRHKKIDKKMQRKLSVRIILGIKITAILLPLVIVVLVPSVEALSVAAAWTLALFAAGCSVAYFAIQQIIAWIGRIPLTKLW